MRENKLRERRGSTGRLRIRATATEGADVGPVSGGSAVGQAEPLRQRQVPRDVRALGAGPGGLLGRDGQAAGLDQAADPDQEHLVRGRRRDPLVRGRRAQRQLQLHRPASAQARRPDRHPVGRRRPRGRQEDHLPRAAREGLQARQRAEGHGRQEGRPGHHLPADDPRGRLRHAGLRPHRRAAFRGVRRLLARQPGRPGQRRRVEADHHLRRRPARRPRRAAQGERRQGAGEVPARRQGADVPAHRHVRADGRGPRLRRRRADEDGQRRLPARADERRGPAVPALHLGLDRQAQGRPAHHRRLSGLRRADPRIRLRLPRRATSTGARPTSAGSPATATSSTARSPTAPRR